MSVLTKPVASRKRSRLNGQKLDTVTSFKYLGSVMIDEGSTPETLQDRTDNSSIDKVETSLE